MGGVGYGGGGSRREGNAWWENGEGSDSRAAAREVKKVARGHGVWLKEPIGV